MCVSYIEIKDILVSLSSLGDDVPLAETHARAAESVVAGAHRVVVQAAQPKVVHQHHCGKVSVEDFSKILNEIDMHHFITILTYSGLHVSLPWTLSS